MTGPDGKCGDVGESDLCSAASCAHHAALHAADLALPEHLNPSKADRDAKSSHQFIVDAIVLWSKRAYQGRSDAREMARNLPKLTRVKNAIHLDFSGAETLEAIATAWEIMEALSAPPIYVNCPPLASTLF